MTVVVMGYLPDAGKATGRASATNDHLSVRTVRSQHQELHAINRNRTRPADYESSEDGRSREALLVSISPLWANRQVLVVSTAVFRLSSYSERGDRASAVVPGIVREIIDPLRH
jgi:hypothetical protein